MFRNRTNSQKPTDELYINFRQAFPEIGSARLSTVANSRQTSLYYGLPDSLLDQQRNQSRLYEHIKDPDLSPRAPHDEWIYTHSLMNWDSSGHPTFTTQSLGCCTDLLPHGMRTRTGLGPALLLPTPTDGVYTGSTVDIHGLPTQTINLHQLHDLYPLAPQHYSLLPQLSHQQSGFESMDALEDQSSMDDSRMDTKVHDDSPIMPFSSQPYLTSMSAPLPAPSAKFRFHVTLNASTAMIKHANEIPTTYLNKGHAYSISIIDTAPTMLGLTPIQYRTVVHISFADEQQRKGPAACWQLWAEGRGISEAYQRSGKLQAVEYVRASQSNEDDSKRTTVSLDSFSLDGFSVLWTSRPGPLANCNVTVQFNFLSTDFSHLKGIQGISSRLCVKTEVISSGLLHSSPEVSEICFCKVKVFRNHGAERKLSNDAAHVRKTIDKLKQQITQAKIGIRDVGNTKRGWSIATKTTNSTPGKASKRERKRTWSISASSIGGQVAAEEDLHLKVQTMQAMFDSTRPISILCLRGQEQDDPDLHSVQIIGEPLSLAEAERKESTAWQEIMGVRRSSIAETSPLASLSQSSASLHSRGIECSEYRSSAGAAPTTRRQRSNFQPMPPTGAALQQSDSRCLASSLYQPVKVQKLQQDGPGTSTGWIKALEVDPSYRPPPERTVKPVACFYILYRETSNPAKNYYQSVYLIKRETKELVATIAAKCKFEPTKVLRITRINQEGLNIKVDNDIVRKLPEGQDMVLEISHIKLHPAEHKWDTDVNTVINREQGSTIQNLVQIEGYELRLIF